MEMKLPKGTFKSLAKILGPLFLWMAAGWAAFPYLMGRVTDAMGEVIDAKEVQLFSYIMVGACIITGIGFIVYGYRGEEVTDAEINALNTERWPCPICLSPQLANAEKCENCGNYIIR